MTAPDVPGWYAGVVVGAVVLAALVVYVVFGVAVKLGVV